MLTNCEDGTGELEMEIKEDKLQQKEVEMEMEIEIKEDKVQQNEARHQGSLWHYGINGLHCIMCKSNPGFL